MRLRITILVVALAAMAPAQVWEKHLMPGLTYRMELDPAVPRIIHALRFSPGTPSVRAESELAGGVVYLPNQAQGRETISEMVARTGAIAGINADFFPFTGDPLGVMVRSGQLVSIPGIQRAVFGWGEKDAVMGLCSFTGTMAIEGQAGIVLDGLDEACGVNAITLNTPAAGLAIGKSGSVHAVFKMDSASWQPNSTNTGSFLYLVSDSDKIPVQDGNAIVTAAGSRTQLLTGLRAGQKVSFRFETKGMDWSRVKQAVGGGPFLVRNGAVSVDASNEHFDDAFTLKRHPRTAVGKTKDGDVWVVVVEGRQETSDGATLDEMARIMQRLGCVEAMNLDGGGSSTINVLGLTLNRPSDGKERPVANGVLFFGPKPDPSEGAYTLATPEHVEVGQVAALVVKNAAGQTVDNADVLWGSKGAAGWVDQGGFLRPSAPGSVLVTASINGKFVTKEVVVEAPPPTSASVREKPSSKKQPADKKKKAGRK